MFDAYIAAPLTERDDMLVREMLDFALDELAPNRDPYSKQRQLHVH